MPFKIVIMLYYKLCEVVITSAERVLTARRSAKELLNQQTTPRTRWVLYGTCVHLNYWSSGLFCGQYASVVLRLLVLVNDILLLFSFRLKLQYSKHRELRGTATVFFDWWIACSNIINCIKRMYSYSRCKNFFIIIVNTVGSL